MPDWMAACDVLVHSTGGLTVLEAMMRGCPAISYGWGRGHVRVNNAAFRRFGLADVVDTRTELRGAIQRALAGGRTSTDSFDRLPSASSFVLAAAMRADSQAAGSLAAWCAPAAAPVVPFVAAAFRIPRRLEPRTGIAITFDDGPHPEGTPAVLACSSAQVRARRSSSSASRSSAAPRLRPRSRRPGMRSRFTATGTRCCSAASPRALRADFERAADVIARRDRRRASFYRPPYGVFSAPALLLVRRLGWQPLLWSRWGRDWERAGDARAIAARATRSLTAGDVVLLHDADHYSSAGSWRRTAAALPSILAAAAATGEPFVTASQST